MFEIPRPLRGAARLALLLLAAGCASSHEPATGLARVLETKELRIGTSGDQPPLTMTAKSGALVGLDVALANVLAQSMGVEPRLVQMPFPRLLDALDAGEVDVVMSGLTITPERSRRATLVGPYYTSGKALLTKSPELAAAETAVDLDRDGLRVVALAGSTSEAFAAKSLPRATLTTTDTLDAAIQQVIAGDVDALIADRETCAFAALRFPDQGLLASKATFTVEPLGIAVARDQQELAQLIQVYLVALREQGALEKATRYWFEDPTWVHDLR